MNSKVLLAFVVLTISFGECLCKPEVRELFPDLLLDEAAKAKLRRRDNTFNHVRTLVNDRGQATLEEIFSNLTRINIHYAIGPYKAHHYQRLAHLSSTRCRKSSYDKAQQMCKTTTMRALKRFCEFCLDELDKYCREEPKEIAKSIIEVDLRKPMTNGVDHLIQEAQDHMDKFEEFSNKSPETPTDENMRKWCETSMPWTRSGQLSACKKLVATVDEEFAHLGLSTSDVRELVEEIEARPIGKQIEFCRSVLKECKVMMHLERYGLGKIDGNVGLI